MMAYKCFILICLIISSNAFVKREVSTSPDQDSLQQHVDNFRKCIDHSLAKVVNDVNVKQLQPIIEVVGDQVNRISKAFQDLTEQKTTTPSDSDF